MFTAITSNPDYQVIAGKRLERNFGDLSQLGLERGKLSKDLHFPLVSDAYVHFPPGGLPYEFGLTADDEAHVYLRFNNLGMGNKKPDDIGPLQQAMKPNPQRLFTDVLATPEITAALDRLGEQAENEVPTLVSFLNSRATTDSELRRMLGLGSLGTIETLSFAPAGQAEGADMVEEDQIVRMTHTQLELLKRYFQDLNEIESSMFELIILNKKRRAGLLDESAFSHPLLRTVYSEIQKKVSLTHVKIPDEFVRLFTEGHNRDEFKVGIHESNAPVKPDDLALAAFDDLPDDEATLVAMEMCIFALHWFQITDNDVDRRAEYAATRTLVARHSLYYDSQEVCKMTVPHLDCSSAEFTRALENFFEKPEPYYVNMFIASISFLKTGHHSNHPNLANMKDKILNALGYQTLPGRTERTVQIGTYYGTHPASMRLMIGYCLHRAVKGNATGAILRRLQVTPPTYAAYVNLELVISALNDIQFFDLMNLKNSYDEFKKNIGYIRRSMHLSAPYSAYLYGEQVPDPVVEKGQVARFAAFLVDLPTILPNSSMLASPALNKMIQEATAVDFGSGLQATAYVNAYKRFYRGIVQKQLTAKLGKAVVGNLIAET